MKPRFLFFASLLTLLISLPLTAQKNSKQEIQYPAIAKELINRREPDQKLRIKWIKMIQKGKKGTKKYEELTEELLATDRANSNRMREIVAEIGWPTYDKVGQRASNAAWILVQHADRQPDLQVYCLPLLKAAYEAGQANPSNYAYLYDRVKRSKGERQRYATQPIDNPITEKRWFGILEDEVDVQTSRTAMEVDQPVVEYAASMGFTYTVPSEEEAKARAKAAHEAFDGFATKARTAMAEKDYSVAAENYLQASYYSGHMTVEDRLNAARAISFGKHKDARSGIYFLFQAVLLGYEDPKGLLEADYFNYLNTTSPSNWKDFTAFIERMTEAE